MTVTKSIGFGILAAAGLCLAIAAGTGSQNGFVAARRAVLSCMMPVGLIWLGLFMASVALAVQKRRTATGWMLTLFVTWTLLGNVSVAGWLSRQTESPPASEPYDQIEQTPLTEPLEAVIVLGGATQTMTGNRIEVGRDGERVLSAAQIWHAGNVKMILTTGSTTRSGTMHPREEARVLLESLGVPPGNIQTLSGVNTAEEMRSINAWLKETFNQSDRDIQGDQANQANQVNQANQGSQGQPASVGQPIRIGLITSAFHIPRAMRLAKRNGLTDRDDLDLVPLPVAFRVANETRAGQWSDVIPGPGPILDISMCLKEWIARLAGQ